MYNNTENSRDMKLAEHKTNVIVVQAGIILITIYNTNIMEPFMVASTSPKMIVLRANYECRLWTATACEADQSEREKRRLKKRPFSKTSKSILGLYAPCRTIRKLDDWQQLQPTRTNIHYTDTP